MPFIRVLLATALLLALAAPAEAVSGGADADPAAYPFSADVGGICTGTLVAPDRVLTAAHCLAGSQLKDVTVRLGAKSRDRLNGPPVPGARRKRRCPCVGGGSPATAGPARRCRASPPRAWCSIPASSWPSRSP